MNSTSPGKVMGLPATFHGTAETAFKQAVFIFYKIIMNCNIIQ